MQRVFIESVTPGMVNARNILNSQGKILLAKGIVLNDFYINRLKGLGIDSVFVLDGITDDFQVPEVISEETRVRTVKGVKEVFSNLASDRSVDSKAVSGMVNSLIDEILVNSGTLIQISEIRAFDDYTFYHSVNVCVLSLMIGVSFGFNALQLKDLGIGAMLHDLGKIKVPKNILEKPGHFRQVSDTAGIVGFYEKMIFFFMLSTLKPNIFDGVETSIFRCDFRNFIENERFSFPGKLNDFAYFLINYV